MCNKIRCKSTPFEAIPENLLLYLLKVSEKKREQATEVCQNHKGNDNSPLGCLGGWLLFSNLRTGTPGAVPKSSRA